MGYIVLSVSWKGRLITPEEKRLLAYREAGHAVAAALTPWAPVPQAHRRALTCPVKCNTQWSIVIGKVPPLPANGTPLHPC